MENKYFDASGFYRPSFFQAEIATDYSLNNLEQLPNEVFATFLHEYTHFLQDISTTFGLLNAEFVVNYMKYCSKEINYSDASKFKIPITIRQEPEHKVYENSTLMKFYSGTSNHFPLPYDITNVIRTQTYLQLDANQTVAVPKIQVHYVEADGENKYFKLGSTIIMENMASLLERIFIRDFEKLWPSTIPYHGAELVAINIHPKFAENPINTLLLCDACLFTFNPGDLFYLVLTDMKSKNWLPQSPMEIYEYCNKFMKFNHRGTSTLFELYELQKKKTIKELQDYFTNDFFEDNKKWIDLVIDSAYNLRRERPLFIFDLAIGGKKVLAEILKKVGTPQITNLLGQTHFFHPRQESYQFLPYGFGAINEIFKIFNGESQGCKLKHVCQSSAHKQGLPDFTDKRCETSPWDRSNDAYLCPFAQIWKMWIRNDKTPVSSP
jgi:hypothetical protein